MLEHFDFELVVCSCFATFVVTQAANTILWRRQSARKADAVAIDKGHAESVAEARGKRKRKMLPAQIAERVVASIRAASLNAMPMIPYDLDQSIERWCEQHKIELVPIGLVREEIALIPGVRRTRPWLNSNDPIHAYIRERQRFSGKEIDRPTIYWIDDLPEHRTTDRTGSNLRPTSVRTDRPSDQPKVRQGGKARPEPRQTSDADTLGSEQRLVA